MGDKYTYITGLTVPLPAHLEDTCGLGARAARYEWLEKNYKVIRKAGHWKNSEAIANAARRSKMIGSVRVRNWRGRHLIESFTVEVQP